MTIDFILDESNLTKAQVKQILESFAKSQDFLQSHSDVTNEILNITDPIWSGSNENNTETIINLGILMCGDVEALQILKHSGVSFNPQTKLATSSKTKTKSRDNECRELHQAFTQTESGTLAWRLISPFLKGNVIYAPENEFTNAIIAQANKSASSMSDFMAKGATFMSLGEFGQSLVPLRQELLSAQVINFT